MTRGADRRWHLRIISTAAGLTVATMSMAAWAHFATPSNHLATGVQGSQDTPLELGQDGFTIEPGTHAIPIVVDNWNKTTVRLFGITATITKIKDHNQTVWSEARPDFNRDVCSDADFHIEDPIRRASDTSFQVPPFDLGPGNRTWTDTTISLLNRQQDQSGCLGKTLYFSFEAVITPAPE